MYLTISRSVENEANRKRDAFIVVFHAITVDHVTWLMARQLLTQVVYGNVIVGLVQDHQLLLPVYFD